MNASVIARKLNAIKKQLETMDDNGTNLIAENKELKADLSNLREELADQIRKNGTLKGKLTKLENKKKEVK